MKLLKILKDHELDSIKEKILKDEELDFEDGVAVLKSNNLPLIGALANYACKKKVGNYCYFVTNQHINYTNICENKCKFCAYYREEGENGAFTLSKNEIMKRALEASKIGVTELHIVGGLNPNLPFEYYEDMLKTLREKYPNMSLQAFTAIEIDYIAKKSGNSIKEVLLRLKEAGLTSLPGGGAEIFNKHIRTRICPNKISGDRWLKVMEIAHNLGIPSNATMLYGHIEKKEDIVHHILKIRDLQKRTNGFQSFIPLSFHPHNTELLKEGLVHYGSTGFEDLKIFAVSRLLLKDYINNIKTFWVMFGEKLAQVTLFYGSNDIDGTVIEEHITHEAGATTPNYLPKQEIIHLIKNAGKIPVERTTNYDILRIYE
ncbi:MAG TPA: aminofutalosine synthase MqnE [Methanosarcinales archaeon]|nr:aminofutalosine synthase MqnE [Methanosarcinales archaeon]